MFKHLFIFLLALSALLSSCSDPCKNKSCNYGICVTGVCACNEGYFESDCSLPLSGIFAGSYQHTSRNCEEASDSIQDYILTLTPIVDNPFSIIITGIHELPDEQFTANVITDGRQFLIPQQFFTDALGPRLDIRGVGNLYEDDQVLQIQYSLLYEGNSSVYFDECYSHFYRE